MARRDNSVPLLIIGALCTLFFICASALLVYSNTKHLIASRDWRDHSQEVLNTLLGASQRLDRIDFSSRLYLTAKNADDLQVAQANAIAVDTGLVHVQELVNDNPAQAQRARQLHDCVLALKEQAIQNLVQGQSPADTILRCRDELSKVQEAERTLLTQRIEESQKSIYRSLMAGVGFLAISLVVVTILFAFLLRDARRRQVVDQQIFSTNKQLEVNVLTLQKRASEAALLMAAREELQLCTTPAQAHLAVVRYSKQLLPSTHAALFIIDNSRHMAEIAAGGEDAVNLMDAFPLDACCGLRSGRLRWRRPRQSEVHCSHFRNAPPENYLCIPLSAHGDTLGVLYIECPNSIVAIDVESNIESLEALAEIASMSIAGLNLRARLEHQSIRDALTGLFNRHFMEISLDRELHRAERNQTPLSLLMLDVDHFKKFNDTFGHEAGDLVLKEVAYLFNQNLRGEDIVCRYGGEEFVMILPEMSETDALEKAENLRETVSQMRLRFHDHPLPPITISIGVAMYPQGGIAMEHLLRSADRALYAAKNNGRNQVVMASSGVIALI